MDKEFQQMKQIKHFFLILLLCLLTLNLMGEEGKLKRIEKELKKKPTHSEEDSDDSDNGSCISLWGDSDDDNDNDNDDNDDNDAYYDDDDKCKFPCVLAQATYYLLIGDSESYKQHSFLTNYPFRKRINNLFCESGKRIVTPYLDLYYFRHSNNLYGYQVDLKIISAAFIEFDFKRLALSEKLSDEVDHLNFTDFSISLNRFRFDYGNIKWGLGCKYIQGDDNYIGFKFQTGLDLYIFKPVSLSFDYNVSWINQNPFNEIQITSKIHYNQVFISGGYKLLKIHREKIPALLVGIGVYF